MVTSEPLIIGTRGSALARWQADYVAQILKTAGFRVEMEFIRTTGDTISDVPLVSIGDKGLFTRELDDALLGGSIDIAVHSLKDLPTTLTEGLTIAAVTKRGSPFDAFVAGPRFREPLTALPPRATVATSSLRREAQLKAWRPDLDVVPVRGNVDTRIAKLDASNWAGIILAAAGLKRLGFQDRIHEMFEPEVMMPAVGQGALAVVCAEASPDVRSKLVRLLDDPHTSYSTRAERAFLRSLEGGCQVPIGAYGRIEDDRHLILDGRVISLDGYSVVQGTIAGNMMDGDALGTTLAHQLIEKGAARILAEVRNRDQ